MGGFAGSAAGRTHGSHRTYESHSATSKTPLRVSTRQRLSRCLGRPVRAVSVPHDRWAASFEKQGMAADRTAPRIEMLDGSNSGWIEFERNGTEPNLGSSTLEETFQDLVPHIA